MLSGIGWMRGIALEEWLPSFEGNSFPPHLAGLLGEAVHQRVLRHLKWKYQVYRYVIPSLLFPMGQEFC
jgi:hypothetical protein